MIKDSKLIGTKIKAPFGWQKFKVGELFDMHSPSGNVLYSSADGVKFDKDDFVRCTTSSRDCNGTPICLPKSSFGEILLRGLSVASNGDAGSVFYHNDEFAVLQDSYALTLKSDSDTISDFTYLFLCGVLNKQSDLFSYTTKAVWKRYNMLEIELPVTVDNQPDFEWMSDYIKVVKADYLEQKALSNRTEIEAYLSAGKVDSTDVTDDERQFLQDFANLPRRKFKVGDLFDVKTGGDFIIGRSEKGDIPLISHQGDNNGISCYVAYDSNYELFDHTCTISLADRGIFKAFCQNDDFYIGTRVKALIAKWKVTSVNELLYFVSIINKFSKMFDDYGLNATSKLPYLELELPVMDSSQIDLQSIEKYMQIQSKPLINKVAEILAPVGGGR